MNFGARLLCVAGCAIICAGGAVTVRISPGSRSTIAQPMTITNCAAAWEDYQTVIAATPSKFELSEIESVIRQDQLAISHHGRIEFGSIKCSGNLVAVQVLFFNARGHLTPYLFTLSTANRSWKIKRAERLWFVPRTELLRGLRV